MKINQTILDTIGNTPLVYLNKLNQNLPAKIALKLEFFNPLGSVKDRIALSMIEQSIDNGHLKPGMTVVEPTSGNTGIGLAMVCAAKGIPLILTMPETMSLERRTLLLLLGAEVVLTPAQYGMKGAIAKTLELVDSNPNYFTPRQFENPANPAIHYNTTAREIWEDTDGKVDIVVSGVGTGGTITGVGTYLKEKNPNIKMVAVEPEESPVLSGGKPNPHKIQGIGAGFIPPVLNKDVIDSIQKVSSIEALEMAKKVIKSEGIPVGISSGAAVTAALREAAKPDNAGKLIICIIPSYTERYLSTPLAEEERNLCLKLPVEPLKDEYLAKASELAQ